MKNALSKTVDTGSGNRYDIIIQKGVAGTSVDFQASSRFDNPPEIEMVRLLLQGTLCNKGLFLYPGNPLISRSRERILLWIF